MKKNIILAVLGIILLAIGLFIVFTNKNSNTANIDIAMNATNAAEAARLISQNNRSEVGSHMLGMFLIGIGGALTVFAPLVMFFQSKSK